MIERSQDYRRINRLMEYRTMISSDVYYLIERQGDEDLGIWYAQPWRDGLALHVTLGEKCRGRRAVFSGKQVLRWLFGHTAFDRIYAILPLERCPAAFMASWIGMEYLYSDDDHRYYGIEA